MKKKALIILIIIMTLMLFFTYENNAIVVSSYEYENKNIPNSFNGFTIVQISDLHNKMFGNNQEIIINKIKEASPDIIVVTGDLIDRRRYNLKNAEIFIAKALKIAPVYYVSGNHENWSGKYDEIMKQLSNLGVILLNNKGEKIKINNGEICIFGLKDPAIMSNSNEKSNDLISLEENLKAFSEVKGFKILLSHRPEIFELYYKYNMDLVFTGHAHGGQFRLPIIGGLYVPNQGLLPEFTHGFYEKNNTTMFVSRGLGNSVMPVRIFNRPEIIKVTLNK